jgi:hypothetical protein
VRLIIDENLSPVIARAARLVIDDSEFLPVTEWAGSGIPDEELFALIAEAQGCLITCDRNQRRTPKVREALRSSGISVFFADQEWANGGRFEQVRRFLNWWPEMVRANDANWPGSWFEVPYRVKSVRLSRLVDSPGPVQQP